MSQSAEAGMCRSVQKVTDPVWVRKGPRVGQSSWVLVNNQGTFMIHFPFCCCFSLWTWPPRLACGQHSLMSGYRGDAVGLGMGCSTCFRLFRILN